MLLQWIFPLVYVIDVADKDENGLLDGQCFIRSLPQVTKKRVKTLSCPGMFLLKS